MKKLILPVLGVLLFGVSENEGRIGQDTCVHEDDISIKTTATKVKLTWINVCDVDEIDMYKVHYTHDAYQACHDGRKDPDSPSGFGTIETTSPEALIENLHPFSKYSIQLTVLKKSVSGKKRIRPERHSIAASTEFSIPKAKAQLSTLDYSYKNTATKLTFNWSPPLLSSQCDKFYSHLGSYVYVLRGIDPWSREDVRKGVLDTTQTLVEVTDLKPYSNYIFFLYLTNTANEYDSDVYLKLEEMTLAAKPQPPELKAVESVGEKTVHLEWMPASPPKGDFYRCIFIMYIHYLIY